MVQDRLKLNRSEAVAYIQKVDDQRRKWTSYLYGVNWEDSHLYDVVLNLEQMEMQEACEGVVTIARQKSFEFTEECLATMADLALASRIRASLALNAPTSDLEVEVVARQGSVSIKGKVVDLDQMAEVERVARGTPGVAELQLDKLGPMPLV